MPLNLIPSRPGRKVRIEVSMSQTKPLWLVLLSAGLIVGAAMGLRQSVGLYLRPITMDLHLGREPFSDAMAFANLIWGLGAVVAGAVADKYGAARVAVFGSLASAAGFLMLYRAQTGTDLMIGGVLLGLGVSGTGITALVGAVGRAAPADRRTAAIATLGMASGIGGFIAFPYVHLLIEAFGWKSSLLVVAVTTIVLMPMALTLRGRPNAVAIARTQTLREAFAEAFALPSFWLLTTGFFVCGFHVSFYSVHIPAFVQDQGLGAWVGVWSLMAVGIANIIGTWVAGQSGKFIQKRIGLSTIYFARAALFVGLLLLPITPATVIIISAALGLFWLSTIPLTSGLVATFFGTSWMSMLFGFVFLSHQLGSFCGLWFAGRLYDATHSYTVMWEICIGLALMAGALHLPIRERPVARVAMAAAE
jgi:MFS family permease